MNLDFLLFSGPKAKYSFMDFWGEAIFIPATVSKPPASEQSSKGLLGSLTNCYRANKNTEVYYSIDAALSDQQGEPTMINELEGTTSNSEDQQQEEVLSHYIPCLYLNSMVGSKYLILYFHASGQDIKIAHPLLNYLRNSYQANVLAMEYPGYSIYPGSPESKCINQNARVVYDYVLKKLGFQEQNVIVIGRSVGTGVALELLRNKKQGKTPNPRCLALISPFASVKSLAKQFVGRLGTLLAKETYDNLENIQGVKCPVFILHGKKDSLISWQQSRELIKNCYTRKALICPETMTHSSFDFYVDLIDPLRQFLLEEGVNFYEQSMKGPVVSDKLFECPEGYKF